MNESVCCSTFSLAFGGVSVLQFCHPNRCVLVSHFNLQFPDDIWYGASFHMLITICISSLVKWLQMFCQFLKSVCSFFYCWVLTFLYMYWITVLYHMCFSGKYFLSAHGLCFHCFNNVFHRAEVFNFNKFQIINYLFHG